MRELTVLAVLSIASWLLSVACLLLFNQATIPELPAFLFLALTLCLTTTVCLLLSLYKLWSSHPLRRSFIGGFFLLAMMLCLIILDGELVDEASDCTTAECTTEKFRQLTDLLCGQLAMVVCAITLFTACVGLSKKNRELVSAKAALALANSRLEELEEKDLELGELMEKGLEADEIALLPEIASDATVFTFEQLKREGREDLLS